MVKPMRTRGFSSALLAIVYLLAGNAKAEFPKLSEKQRVIEWNAQSDAVGGSHVAESRLAFESFARDYLAAPDSNIVKVPDTGNLADFEATVAKATGSSGSSSPDVLRIFVNSHGSTDSFQSHDSNTEIYWEDFVASLAKVLKAAKIRPGTVELYLSPCFSGSIIPSLKKYLSKTSLDGVEVNVWTGSSGFTTTSSPEFPEAVRAFADLKFTLEKYLDRTLVCSENQLAIVSEDPIDLIGSLGGISYSEFWTNSGKKYRRLSAEELQRLLASDNPFLEERALTSLLQMGEGDARSASYAAAIVKNPARDYYLRTLAAKYLGYLPRNGIALDALAEVARDPKTQNSAYNIRSAAIDAMGYSDPASGTRLIEMFESTEFAEFKGPILAAIGATKNPAGAGIIRKNLESADSNLKESARIAYFRSQPADALSYFEGKLKDVRTSDQDRYGICGSMNQKMPPELAPRAARLLIDEYDRATGIQKLYVLRQIGSLAKEQKATRETIRKEFLPKVRAYAEANLDRAIDRDSAEGKTNLASRLLQFVLEE